MRKFLAKVLLSVIGVTLVLPSSVFAAQFDPSFVISNKDIENSASMQIFEIQKFLANRSSFLSTFVAPDYNGVLRSATEIIYEASQLHGINPKWILVTLQKEQSLIDDPDPSQDQLDWAMGYAVCDSCSKSDPLIQKFKGFGKQIHFATARIRYYIQNPHAFNFKAGNTYTIDGMSVTLKNQATAYLYNYTPHLHGNYNFWKLWSQWFTQTYPDGSLLQIEGDKGVWYVENGVRRPILSKAVLVSRFNPKDIIKVSKTDLEQLPYGPALRFPNYSVVESIKGDRYLLVDDEKKMFESDEVFRRLGFNDAEVDIVEDRELEVYKEGRPITLASAYPAGQLIQDSTSGGVFFVKDGFKHPIVSKEILKANYPTHTIIKGDKKTLDGFVTADKALFKDGKLIKSKEDPTVYVISNGKRRAIANEDTFNRLGYSMDDVITTSADAVNIHPLDEPIDTVIKSNNS